MFGSSKETKELQEPEIYYAEATTSLAPSAPVEVPAVPPPYANHSRPPVVDATPPQAYVTPPATVATNAKTRNNEATARHRRRMCWVLLLVNLVFLAALVVAMVVVFGTGFGLELPLQRSIDMRWDPTPVWFLIAVPACRGTITCELTDSYGTGNPQIHLYAADDLVCSSCSNWEAESSFDTETCSYQLPDDGCRLKTIEVEVTASSRSTADLHCYYEHE